MGDASPYNSYSSPNGFRLGKWTANQRTSYRKGTLSKERITLLEALGFIWEKRYKIVTGSHTSHTNKP